MKRGKPLERKSRLRPVSVRKAMRERDAVENSQPGERARANGVGVPKRRAVSPASPEQRAKVKGRNSSKRDRSSSPVWATKRRAVSPASREQRAKVNRLGCRVHGEACGAEAAHIIDRSLGGCDHPDCAIPLCRLVHRAYDEGRIDLLPWLTHAEQAHAVEHLGLLRALRRITGLRWVPENPNTERY